MIDQSNEVAGIDRCLWDFENPFTLKQQVSSDDIDIMGHTNNVVYLKWLEQVAWAHSGSLGLGWDTYSRLNRGMVAQRHELDYLAATHEGDELMLATWVIENDRKVTIARAYQIIRISDQRTVLRGRTRWVCVDIASGKPRRMPDVFVTGYAVAKSMNGR